MSRLLAATKRPSGRRSPPLHLPIRPGENLRRLYYREHSHAWWTLFRAKHYYAAISSICPFYFSILIFRLSVDIFVFSVWNCSWFFRIFVSSFYFMDIERRLNLSLRQILGIETILFLLRIFVRLIVWSCSWIFRIFSFYLSTSSVN